MCISRFIYHPTSLCTGSQNDSNCSFLGPKNKIIYLTSNSGYGIGEKNKYCDENSPIRPISLYGRTKCEAEKLVNEFQNSVCFRLATVFGYSYRMRSDLLVNNFVSTALNKNKLLLSRDVLGERHLFYYIYAMIWIYGDYSYL